MVGNVQVGMNVTGLGSFFSYNEWANARLVAATADLSNEQFTKDLGSSFRSIRDTLSHIIAVEWVWLRRWKGESPLAAPEWAASPTHETLRNKLREVETERSVLLATLSESNLRQLVAYKNLKGEQWSYLLGDLLLHLVNHSTYHRGQITTMLRQIGVAPPSTDLLIFKGAL